MVSIFSTLVILALSAAVVLRLKPIGPGPRAARRRVDRRVAAGLFSGALLAYSLTLPGITATLDEDLAALTRSLARAGTFVIDDYSRGFHDASRYEDHFYAHKTPGTSILAIPFYLAGEYWGSHRDNDAVLVRGSRFHLRADYYPQRVVMLFDDPIAGDVRIIIHDTAANPENLTLTGVRCINPSAGAYPASDEQGTTINVLVDGPHWASRESMLAWPAEPGGIGLPLTLELGSGAHGTARGLMFTYSGLFPEMVATEWTVDSCLSSAAARRTRVHCWSWIEGQRRIMGLGSAVCAALAVVCVYLLSRRLDVRPGPAALGAVLVAIASLHWRYAGTLYNHAPLTLAVMGLLHTTISGRQDAENRHTWALCSGACGGLGLLTDTVFAIPLAAALLAWVHTIVTRPASRWMILRNLSAPLIVACVLLGLYQALCFGSPWRMANQYSFDHEWLRSFSTAFDHSLWKGMLLLLYGMGRAAPSDIPEGFVVNPADYRGLLVSEPIVILAVVGLVLCYRRRKYEVLLLGGAFLSTLVLMAKFHTPWGGGDEDTRYLVHVTPALYVGVALWWEHVWSRADESVLSRRKNERPMAMHAALWIVGILTAFHGLRQTWDHLGEGLGRWENTWKTGFDILPSIPKPTGYEALWLAAPIIGLVLFQVWWTTRETPIDGA